MCLALYDQRTAVLATIVFAITPSLLKWHFQVRGYSWYFLSIPVLTLLFLSIESTPNRRWPRFFLFGIVSGLSIWSLDLGVALAGFVIGYAPAVAFNLAYHFANWRAVIEKTGGGGFAQIFRPETAW